MIGGLGMAALLLTVGLETLLTRTIHGDTFVGGGDRHTRFGPDARTGKPEPGKKHP